MPFDYSKAIINTSSALQLATESIDNAKDVITESQERVGEGFDVKAAFLNEKLSSMRAGAIDSYHTAKDHYEEVVVILANFETIAARHSVTRSEIGQ
jgi:hypothetical protein